MFNWFKSKESVLLSSSVQGQLNDGQIPLQGIKVTRLLIYGKEYLDTTTTDENGKFNFSEKIISSNKPNNMLDNDAIRQEIYIKNKNEKVLVWSVRLYTTTPNDHALTTNLNNLICNIQSPAQTYDLVSEEDSTELLTIYTLCRIKT